MQHRRKILILQQWWMITLSASRFMVENNKEKAQQYLILLSVDRWRDLADSKDPWLSSMPSLLIIKK